MLDLLMPGSQETQELTDSCYRQGSLFSAAAIDSRGWYQGPSLLPRGLLSQMDSEQLCGGCRTGSTASPPPEELGCPGQMASLRSRRKGWVTRARRGSPILLAISQYLRSNHDPCLGESLAGHEGARSGDNLTPRPQLFRLHARRSPR